MPAWSRASGRAAPRCSTRVDVLDGLEHALAAVALRIAVAQLDRLARAGGGARGHRGAAVAPESSITSASTVGLPRESRISRRADVGDLGS